MVVGWEAAVKASLLVALVLIIGFVHQSSQKQLQRARLAHAHKGSPRMPDVPAQMGTDETHELASSQLRTNCLILSADETLRHACTAMALWCDQYSAAGVSTLIDNMQTLAASRSRPRLTSCAESVAINSSMIGQLASVSAYS